MSPFADLKTPSGAGSTVTAKSGGILATNLIALTASRLARFPMVSSGT
jgi:hypothetical protein